MDRVEVVTQPLGHKIVIIYMGLFARVLKPVEAYELSRQLAEAADEAAG